MGVKTFIDIVCLIDIILTFFTAYLKDQVYHNHIKDIWFNYIKNDFIFDAAATIPCIILGQNSWYYPLKLIRFIHAYKVYNFVTGLFKDLYKKLALPHSFKVTYVFELLVYLLSSVHFLGCMWIYLGKKIEGSWMSKLDPNQ